MQNFQSLLTTALKENNIILDAKKIDKLAQYLTLLQTWNKAFNLTNITEPRDMVYLHIVDSLVIAPYLHGTHFLDVGSGAGLPGIPLAIMHPEQQWTMLDKNNKKTRFMTQAIAELKLTNAKAAHSRCEDFQPEQCFDSILSRAFGSLHLFVETTKHLLCDNGIFIAMKGKYPQEELDDLPNTVTVTSILPLEVKGLNADRHLVCLKNNH